MPDNSQFTEAQLTEAFRTVQARHLERQTQALEAIRNYLLYLLIMVLLGIVVGVVATFGSSSGL